LSPLELGDSNSLFIVIGVVVLVGIVIGLILTISRRASAMSDELAKQSKAKFQAIVPTSVSASRYNSQVTEVKEKTQPLPARTDTLRETSGYLALRKEVFETKFKLEQFIRENRLIEKQLGTRPEIEKLITEVSSLRERLSVDAQEMEKLKASLADQDIKLHSQRQDIEDQRARMGKVWEQPEVGKLKAELNSLQERLLTTSQELQNLKTKLDEQNLKLQHILDVKAQRAGVVEVAHGPQIVSPVQSATKTFYPRTEPAPDSTFKRCVSCGFPLHSRDNYCEHCGAPIDL